MDREAQKRSCKRRGRPDMINISSKKERAVGELAVRENGTDDWRGGVGGEVAVCQNLSAEWSFPEKPGEKGKKSTDTSDPHGRGISISIVAEEKGVPTFQELGEANRQGDREQEKGEGRDTVFSFWKKEEARGTSAKEERGKRPYTVRPKAFGQSRPGKKKGDVVFVCKKGTATTRGSRK